MIATSYSIKQLSKDEYEVHVNPNQSHTPNAGIMDLSTALDYLTLYCKRGDSVYFVAINNDSARSRLERIAQANGARTFTD